MTELTPRFHMMDFQHFCRTAILTTPSIPVQHLIPECFIHLRMQLQSWLSLVQSRHVGLPGWLASDGWLKLFHGTLNKLKVAPHEGQRQLENRRKSSLGNNRVTCQPPASARPFQELAQQPEPGSCRA